VKLAGFMTALSMMRPDHFLLEEDNMFMVNVFPFDSTFYSLMMLKRCR